MYTYSQFKKIKDVPSVKEITTYPTNYVVTLIPQKKASKLKLRKDALKLLEHIEIVAEARQLYSQGDVMTWEEFSTNET